jgi:hypothetical protein
VTQADGLIFTGEMYGVQLDQLAVALGVGQRRAASLLAGWQQAGSAEAATLGPGPRWLWLTRAGLATCGLPYIAGAPGLSRLAHLRAVTAVRLALAGTPHYAAAGAHWRSERRLRARMGGRIGLREHVPDAQVHWPDLAPAPCAGESWAIEAELTPKTIARTVAIMRDVLTRTGDYGCPAAEVRVPGRAPIHARVIYVCSPAARPVVSRARDALGGAKAGAAGGADDLADRIEIRLLPERAMLPRAAPRGVAARARATRQ